MKLGVAPGKSAKETPCAFEKNKRGSCKLGDKCAFSHAESVLSAVVAVSSATVAGTTKVAKKVRFGSMSKVLLPVPWLVPGSVRQIVSNGLLQRPIDPIQILPDEEGAQLAVQSAELLSRELGT